jgi:maltose alpha-D-glucosyltransferase/alpha-amylase
MGFHDYFWFILQKEEEPLPEKSTREIPVIKSNMDWTQLFNNQIRAKIENQVLPPFLREQRWFGSKAQKILKINISEVIPVKNSNGFTIVLIIKVSYAASAIEYYHLPLSFLEMEQAKELLSERPQSVLFHYQSANQEGLIYDAVLDEEFHRTLLQLVARRRVIQAWDGKLKAYPGKYFKNVRQFIGKFERSNLLNTEQSNSSIVYDRQLIFKLFRKLDEGTNPDLEVVKYITEKTDYKNVPAFAGALEYQKKDGSQITLGILYPYVASEGNAWDYTQDHLSRYYERVLSQLSQIEKLPALPISLFEKSLGDMPEIISELIGAHFIEMIYLLGKRTAELHKALANTTEDPDFKPESFSILYQRSIFQSIQSLIKRIFLSLRKNYNQYPETIQNEVKEILSLELKIITYCREILAKKIEGKKIRIHGDYHLGQVLYTGNDFYIIDFEGEPAKPLGERKLKRSPLKDVAGMLRSFHYAAFTPLIQKKIMGEYEKLEYWAKLWTFYISKIYLNAYLEYIESSSLIPKDRSEMNKLLSVYLLEKAVYEIGYEMNNRPDWLAIPLKGILFEIGAIDSEKRE